MKNHFNAIRLSKVEWNLVGGAEGALEGRRPAEQPFKGPEKS